MRGAWLQALSVGALVALGLLGVLSALAGSAQVAGISRILMASPLPLVFGRQGGMEQSARRFELLVQLADGSVRMERRAPLLQAGLPGPFTATAPYAGVLVNFSAVHEPRRTDLLRRTLCDDGPVARALALPSPVRRFELRGWSELGPQEPEQTIAVECPP